MDEELLIFGVYLSVSGFIILSAALSLAMEFYLLLLNPSYCYFYFVFLWSFLLFYQVLLCSFSVCDVSLFVNQRGLFIYLSKHLSFASVLLVSGQFVMWVFPFGAIGAYLAVRIFMARFSSSIFCNSDDKSKLGIFLVYEFSVYV